VVIREKRLEILHDHYKETFARQQKVESSRDRLFYAVILLYGLLSFEVGYPAGFNGAFGKLTFAGIEVSPQSLPLPALLDVTWVLTLAVGLRYCQLSVHVNRQYDYIHSLEDVISPMVGGGMIYRREGQAYLQKYPALLNVAWIAYVFIFPVIVLGATIALLVWEWRRLPYAWGHLAFDTAIGVVIIGFFTLYQVVPSAAKQIKRLAAWYNNFR